MSDRIGLWALHRFLGAGGNGEVWEARHDDGVTAALKVLKSTDPRDERYRRFRDEIAILERISGRRGILPMLDSHLPTAPTKGDRAWLATPLALPLMTALGENASLDAIVAAIHDVATTLAAIHDEGIFHRDLKPDNLFSLKDQWVIGDFGLVSYPDKQPLTGRGRKVGPANFLAPEMRDAAHTALGGPADVYALAKTLWVVVSGQNFPPLGPQRADDPSVRLDQWFDGDRRTRSLDRLLEQATVNDPLKRVTMKQFAAELRAWSTPVTSATPHDLADFARRTADVLSESEGRRQDQLRLEGFVREAFAIFGPGLDAVISSLRSAQFQPSVTTGSPEFMMGIQIVPPSDISVAQHHVAWVHSDHGSLYCGAWCAVTSEGRLHMTAGHVLRRGQESRGLWQESLTVVGDLPSAVAAIAGLRERWRGQLRPAVDAFLRQLER